MYPFNLTRGTMIPDIERQYLTPGIFFNQKRILDDLQEKYSRSLQDNELLRTKLQQFTPAVVVVEEVTPKVAKEKIIEYLKNNPGSYTSQIAYDLRLPIKAVLKAISSLKKVGKIE